MGIPGSSYLKVVNSWILISDSSVLNMLVIVLLLAGVCQSLKQPCILVSHFDSNTICEQAVGKTHTASKNESQNIIRIDTVAEFDAVVEFVSRAFKGNQGEHGRVTGDDCSEVVGVVGDLDLKTASIIHTLASRANLSITLVSAVAPSTFLPTTNLALPNLLDMNPLTHYMDALVAFCDHLNWTRIGLIGDSTHYYQFAAELLQQKLLENPERRITPFVRINEGDNTTRIIHTFKEYETDVIIISTSDRVACLLMQEAMRIGFKWPEYAWILLDVSFCLSVEACLGEGTILLTEQSHEKDNFLPLEESNSVFNISFPSHANFRDGKLLINVTIAQINSFGSREEVAFYNTESQRLNVLSSFLVGDKPRGTILEVKFADLFNVTLQVTLVMLLSSILFIFVTVVLILYVCFRKEPEVKATSITVSLCMFLGCYILISYLPLSVVDLASSAYCSSLIWVSIAGIPLPLIAATLFVKMLRVYWIFSNPFSYKKKLLTDPFLLLYILLLVSPSLFILVLWSSYDPYMINLLELPRDNYILLHTRCNSEHTTKWPSVLLIYYFILSLALTCLALKTSKIRYQIFRDTKATNAFVYLSSLVAVLTLIYWSFFRLQGVTVTAVLATRNIVYAGNSILTMLCQILLFVPKVYPPLKRSVIV